jgi:hypothetical protein
MGVHPRATTPSKPNVSDSKTIVTVIEHTEGVLVAAHGLLGAKGVHNKLKIQHRYTLNTHQELPPATPMTVTGVQVRPTGIPAPIWAAIEPRAWIAWGLPESWTELQQAWVPMEHWSLLYDRLVRKVSTNAQ